MYRQEAVGKLVRFQVRLVCRVAALARASATKASSSAEIPDFMDPRLISTLERAPVSAACARATAVMRSEAMLGLVIGLSDSAMRIVSAERSATVRGTLVAWR